MRIAIASDHAAWELKAALADWLRGEGHEVVDLGTLDPEALARASVEELRKAGLSDPIETTGLWTAAIAVLLMALIAPFVWIAPDGHAWGLLLLTGLLGTMGHMCLFKALELAPASAVQPFSYMMMVWAALLGFLVFGAFPDAWTVAGALIIAASGLYAFARERRRPARAL